MSIGIKEYEFWQMNPRRIILHTKGFGEKTKQQLEYDNVVAFVSGQYIMDALLSTVGNMLGGKKSKPFEYPSKPYNLKRSSFESKDGLSEEEIQAQREAFVANFMAMKSNFEINHPKNKDKDNGIGQES